jgi:hypothetical protein
MHGNPARSGPPHRPLEQKERYWRTREGPFEAVWPTILEWLDGAPESNAKWLLERLQATHAKSRWAVTNLAASSQRMAKR